MSTFTLTRGSEAALGMLASQAGSETLLLTQPARELRAELSIEPFTGDSGDQLLAVLFMREQRHSMTLQRDDSANAQHLADWIEAVANGTVDTAEAIPQRADPSNLPAATAAFHAAAHELNAQQPVVLEGWRAGVEAVVAMIEKKAADFAAEFGHIDMGALSFGIGHRADIKRDHHSSLVELAEEVRSALAAPIAQTAPDGWQLVPMEPTQAMREAFHAATERYEDGYGESPDSQWHAMLRAALATSPTA